MHKKFIGAIALAVLLVSSIVGACICTEKIPAGYVGVVYSMSGGVEDTTLQQGWHLMSPMKKAYEFTVGNEQLVLSKDSREGSDEDESFFVATSDNANIAVSFQMSYSFDEAEVVKTFTKFRGMDGEDIVRSRVRTVLKAKISEITKDYSMMQLYSGGRDEINKKLTVALDEALHEQFGLHVIDAGIIDVHPDAALQQTIADRVAALQRKQQAQAEAEEIKVRNETKILQAEADAKEAKIKAEGAAEVKRIAAKAEADAMAELNKNITPDLIAKIKADKWDGKMPAVVGGESIVNAADILG